MQEKNTPLKDVYDDDNIPEIDLPQESEIAEVLPEYTIRRKINSGKETSK